MRRVFVFLTKRVQVLRRSESMDEPSMKDILQSLLAVLFLGCPHRDSQHGKIGDAVKSMAATMLRVDFEDPVLQDLSGANSPNLNLGRQAFIRLWNDYNFRVRTYQEQAPLQSTLREEKPEHVRYSHSAIYQLVRIALLT